MNFSCTLASRMEAGVYFAPSITVIELAQETSICIPGSQVDPLDSTHDGIKIEDEDLDPIW